MSVPSITTTNLRARESAEQFISQANAKRQTNAHPAQTGQAGGGVQTGQGGQSATPATPPSHASSGGFSTGRILNITA